MFNIYKTYFESIKIPTGQMDQFNLIALNSNNHKAKKEGKENYSPIQFDIQLIFSSNLISSAI